MKTRHVVGAMLLTLFLVEQGHASGLEDALAYVHNNSEPCRGATQLFTEEAIADFVYFPPTRDIDQYAEDYENVVRELAKKLQYPTCVRVAVLPLSGPFKGFAVPASDVVGPWPWILANTHGLNTLNPMEIRELVAHEFAHITAGLSENGEAHWSEWSRLFDEYKKLLNEQGSVAQH